MVAEGVLRARRAGRPAGSGFRQDLTACISAISGKFVKGFGHDTSDRRETDVVDLVSRLVALVAGGEECAPKLLAAVSEKLASGRSDDGRAVNAVRRMGECFGKHGERESVERRYLLQFVVGLYTGDELRALGWEGLGLNGQLLKSVREYVEANGVGPAPQEWQTCAGRPCIPADAIAASDAIWRKHMQFNPELFGAEVLDAPAGVVQREIVEAGVLKREAARTHQPE